MRTLLLLLLAAAVVVVVHVVLVVLVLVLVMLLVLPVLLLPVLLLLTLFRSDVSGTVNKQQGSSAEAKGDLSASPAQVHKIKTPPSSCRCVCVSSLRNLCC